MLLYSDLTYAINGADGVELKQTYKADFVCYGKIIIELKAVSALDDAHRSQVYNYLHATGFKLGLLYRMLR